MPFEPYLEDQMMIHVYEDEHTHELSLWTLIYCRWICIDGSHLGHFADVGTPVRDLHLEYVGAL